MNRDNNPIRNWLVFSVSEKRGISVLLVLLLILLTIRFVQKQKSNHQLRLVEIQNEIPSGSSSYTENEFVDSLSLRHFHSSRSFTPKGESFNPNNASLEELIDQGIPEEISRRIIKYRKKGGVFNKPADLYKIYGIDSLMVTELLNWVVIEAIQKPTQVYQTQKNQSYSMRHREVVEINSADSLLLCELPGIGSVLSSRIIRYRNILGGFHTTEQLKDVYGISDSLFISIANDIEADTSVVKKLSLNSATLVELQKHPYLTNYEAKAIMSYRRLIGPFTSCNELVDNYILSENTYRKVKVYLSLN